MEKEPNPYEPPRSAEPLTRGQIVKRRIGVGLILLLTPPAMVVAVLTSCAFSPRNAFDGMKVYLGCPLALLTALMIWASVIESRKNRIEQAPKRIGCLLATPVAVLVATGFGFWLAALAYGTWMSMDVVFWLVPSAALLAMLVAAWRTQ